MKRKDRGLERWRKKGRKNYHCYREEYLKRLLNNFYLIYFTKN